MIHPAAATFVLALCLPNLAPAQGQEIGFDEIFALSENRREALEQLIPGTEDYYYYSCLQLQHEGKIDQVPALLETWIKRHGQSARVREIENRQALVDWASDPTRVMTSWPRGLDYLTRTLGLSFDHTRQKAGDEVVLPSTLAPSRIAPKVWEDNARRLHPDSMDGFGDRRLESLAAGKLSDRQLTELLKRLQRPDVPGLADLVVRELKIRSSRKFGSLDIHNELLPEQLEACAKSLPKLLNDPAFVSVYLTKLRPSADVDWTTNVAEREAFLDRLWALAQRLDPAHNDLKAHVLQHRLIHDLGQGKPSRETLMEFLQLPRRTPLANPEWLKTRRNAEIVEKPNASLTPFGSPGDEEPLVRAYLEHFFGQEESWEAFSPYVKADYLRRLFAETKILAGTGDMERWYSLIDDPAYYEALENRVELEFPATQSTEFATGAAVSLDLDIKNVKTLLVKVFEIDALTYALAENKEVDASIDLDGLVAGAETTYSYDAPSLRRIRKHFEFPELTEAGVYVIDFIGGGISSRAVIRKGHLEVRERNSSAGHVFEVVDAAGVPRTDAAIYFGGQRYEAEGKGIVLLPYSTEPGRRTAVVASGGSVSVHHFSHRAETYSLRAGFYVDRESLIAGSRAKLLVSPRLEVNGQRVSLDLLEDVSLNLTARTLDGTKTSLDVRDVGLLEGREWVHEFRVPNDFSKLDVSLTAKIQVLSDGKRKSLSSGTQSFAANSIDGSRQVDCPILGQDSAGYFIDLLGKNGEPKAGRILNLSLRHRDYHDALSVQLKTDDAGRLHLGHLVGVDSLRSSGLPGGFGYWSLAAKRQTVSGLVQGQEGDVLRIPYRGDMERLGRDEVSLLELRGGTPVANRSGFVSLEDGFVTLSQLAAGDYDLLLKETGDHIQVRVTAGERQGRWSVGASRALELRATPLHVTSAQMEGGDLVIRLTGTNPYTRLHVVTSRFDPAFDAFTSLDPPGSTRGAAQSIRPTSSEFHSGRQIGEEYRYILERRYAKIYPGNMLSRPGLLLNPWALQDTHDVIGTGGGAGGRFGGRHGGGANARGNKGKGEEKGAGLAPGIFPNLEFLEQPSTVLTNLRPDAEGVLRIAGAQLGAGGLIRVVAFDGENMVQRRVTRTGKALQGRDRRLADGMPPEAHFSQKRRMEFLAPGEETTLSDKAGSDLASYETLGDVFDLFMTLRPDLDLDSFEFLLDWPQMDDEAKGKTYSEFACHELHMFLYEKDPEFFSRVVRPFLANKADKTFLDLWLLDGDLSGFLDPWSFSRLNTLEQILLADREEGIGENVSRLIDDRIALAPPAPATLERLYFFSLGGSDLKLAEKGKSLSALKRYKGPGDTTPPGGGGGGGGGRGPASPGAPAEESAVREGGLRALGYADEEEPALQDAEAITGSEDFFLGAELQQDKAYRGRVQNLYSGIGATEQFIESNYWRNHEAAQGKAPIGANAFWLDLARTPKGSPFHSTHFAQATGSTAEALMALALLDLPFEAGENAIDREDGEVTIQAATPLMLVTKELARVQPDGNAKGLLVGQQFYPLSEGPDAIGSFDFVRGVAYGCRVVVTNPSAQPLFLELLLQIPTGALPVARGSRTRSHALELTPYATQSVEYAFYFPAAGEFTHYPAHATSAGQYLAHAPARAMTVLAAPETVDTESWHWVSQHADLPTLLDHMEKANLMKVSLSRVAWRLRDREAYDAILSLLRERHLYDHTIWSYGMHHTDLLTIQEYLRHANSFVNQCGPWLDSTLLKIDPIERLAYERMEFSPLINARAHLTGTEREILNGDFARQYLALMNILSHKPLLDDVDWMSVTYQFLLQDRVEEALASFKKVDPSGLPMSIQYDYMDAYLDFFSSDHDRAGAIAEKYADHPVPHWRSRFLQIQDHLAEAAGEAATDNSNDTGNSGNDALAREEPTLELEVEAGQVTLEHRHLASCELRYYVMDVEFLFSTSPFVQQGSGAFSYVKANRLDAIALPDDNGSLTLDLPAELRSSNVLVEARAGALVRRQAYYANTLRVQVIESYGQVKVTDSGTDRPLAKAYVKVYVQDGDNVRFHKDGYTDLRGRFDYVSVSGASTRGIKRYALLVIDEEHGAVIREVAPPVQ
ncbi:MAG: hypothetical protein CMJ98_04560 [Planctomycetes bacterium]|nr:hypothetical protein [Planctomycetota bacterium]HJM56273.1 hypothetical protein [Planctomycetota bacterium]